MVINIPARMTNTLQHTISIHLSERSCLPALQLSYSHMQPMGWKDIMVPRRAPISETRPPKTGMPLAIRYAMTTVLIVQPPQVIQWVWLLPVRCFELRRMRTKAYLTGN